MWVKVTLHADAGRIYVNMDHLTHLRPTPHGTSLVGYGDASVGHVQESPQKILRAARNARQLNLPWADATLSMAEEPT